MYTHHSRPDVPQTTRDLEESEKKVMDATTSFLLWVKIPWLLSLKWKGISQERNVPTAHTLRPNSLLGFGAGAALKPLGCQVGVKTKSAAPL